MSKIVESRIYAVAICERYTHTTNNTFILLSLLRRIYNLKIVGENQPLKSIFLDACRNDVLRIFQPPFYIGKAAFRVTQYQTRSWLIIIIILRIWNLLVVATKQENQVALFYLNGYKLWFSFKVAKATLKFSSSIINMEHVQTYAFIIIYWHTLVYMYLFGTRSKEMAII